MNNLDFRVSQQVPTKLGARSEKPPRIQRRWNPHFDQLHAEVLGFCLRDDADWARYTAEPPLLGALRDERHHMLANAASCGAHQLQHRVRSR